MFKKLPLFILILLGFYIQVFGQGFQDILNRNNYFEVKAELKNNPELAQTKLDNGFYPIHLCARDSKNQSLLAILEFDSLLNKRSNNNFSALYLAVYNKNYNAAAVLYIFDSDTIFPQYENLFSEFVNRDELFSDFINKVDKSKEYYKQNIKYFLAGLELGIDRAKEIYGPSNFDINFCGPFNNNLLHIACREGNFDEVQKLVKLGSNINLKGVYGYTALHLVARNNYIKIYDYLINKGANELIESDSLETPYIIAIKHHSHWIIEYYKNKTSSLKLYNEAAQFWDSLKSGNGNIQIFEDKSYLFELNDYRGQNIIHHAIIGNDIKSLKWAFSKNNKINQKDIFGFTPLMRAIVNGNFQMHEELLKLGADTAVFLNNVVGIYHFADVYNKEALQYLKNPKAYLSFNKIINLYQNNKIDQIDELLKDKTIDLTYVTQQGISLAHWAASKGHKKLLDKLEISKSQFLKSISDGIPSLAQYLWRTEKIDLIYEYFKKYGMNECLDHVLENENKNNSSNYYIKNFRSNPEKIFNTYMVQESISNGNDKMFKKFMKKGIDINYSDDSWTLIHYAARKGKVNYVKELVKIGFDINQKTKDAYSPLFLAAYNNNYEVVKYIIKEINEEIVKQDYRFQNLISDSFYFETKLLINNEEAFTHLFKKFQSLEESIKRNKNLNREVIKKEKLLLRFKNEEGKTLLHIASEIGYAKLVEELLDLGFNANEIGVSGQSPIFFALKNNHFGCADILIDNGAEIQLLDFKDKDPADYCYSSECIKYYNNQLKNEIEKNYCQIIYLYASLDKVDEFKNSSYQCKLNNYIDLESKEGILHRAIRKGSKDLVQLVLSRIMNPDFEVNRGDSTYTALDLALHLKKYDLAELLVKFGSNINYVNNKGQSLFQKYAKDTFALKVLNKDLDYSLSIQLFESVEKGDYQKVDELLKKGVNPNSYSDRGGFRAAHIAAREGHSAILLNLIEHGADVNLLSKSGLSPIYLAWYNENFVDFYILFDLSKKQSLMPSDEDLSDTSSKFYKVLYQIFLKGEKKDLREILNNYSLRYLAELKDTKVLSFLINDGFDIYKPDFYGWNIYHYWARYNCLHLDDYLEFKRFDLINSKIPEGAYTPFIISVINGNLEIARKLIQYGADTSNYLDSSKSWLNLAEQYNQWNLIEQINPSYPGLDYHKFWNAAVNNNKDIIQNYLNKGLFSINSVDSFGFTLLHFAARNSYKDFEYFDYLLTLNPDINKQNKFGWTALMLALNNGNFHYAYKLLELGADLNFKNDRDSTTQQILESKEFPYGKDFFNNPKQVSANYELTIAVDQFHYNLLKEALDKGADPDFIYPNLLPPLATCIREQKHDLVDLLIQYKADINLKFYTSDGYFSPLFIALLNNNWVDFKKLIKLNADIKFVSSDNVSIADLARKKGYFYEKALTQIAESESDFEKYLLLKKGIELNSPIIIDQALYLGADFNAKDPESGLLPIQLAISKNKYKSLKHLIFRGIDKNVWVQYEDKKINLVEYAVYSSLDEMALILINSGIEMPNLSNLNPEYFFNKDFLKDWEIISRNPLWFEEIGLKFYNSGGIQNINKFIYKDSSYFDSILSTGIIKTIWLELALGLNPSISYDKIRLKEFNDLDWAEKLISKQNNNEGLFEFSLFLGLLQKFSGINNLDLMKINVSLNTKKKFILDNFILDPQGFSDNIFEIYKQINSPTASKIIYKPFFFVNDSTTTNILNYQNSLNFGLYNWDNTIYNDILTELVYKHGIQINTNIFPNNDVKNQYLFSNFRFALRDNNPELIKGIIKSGIPINVAFRSDYFNQTVLELIFYYNKFEFLNYIPEDSLFNRDALKTKSHIFNLIFAEGNDNIIKVYEDKFFQKLPLIKNYDFCYSLISDAIRSGNSEKSQYLWYLINKISEYNPGLFSATPYNSSVKNIISFLDSYFKLDEYSFSSELIHWLRKFPSIAQLKTEKGETIQDIFRRKQYFEYQRALVDPLYIRNRNLLFQHIEADSISSWLVQNIDFLLMFKDNSGNNLLQYVYNQYNNQKLLDWLFIDKRFYNNNNNLGENIYHNISQSFDKQKIQRLALDKDLLIKKDLSGKIPLHYAVENRELFLISLFKEFGLEIKSNDGYTAKQIAIKNSCQLCIEALDGKLYQYKVLSRWEYDSYFQEYMSKAQYDSALSISNIFINQSKLLYGVNHENYSIGMDNKVLALGYKGLLIDAAAISEENFENQRKLNSNASDLIPLLIDYAIIQKLALNYQKALVALEEAKDLLSKNYISNSSELSLSVFEGLADLYSEFDREDLILLEYEEFKSEFKNLGFISLIKIAEILENSDSTISKYYYKIAYDTYLNRKNKTFFSIQSETHYVNRLFNFLLESDKRNEADSLIAKYKLVNDSRGEIDNDRWFYAEVEDKRANYSLALKYLDSLIQNHSDNENISLNNYLYRQGQIYWKLGDTLNAYASLKKSTELKRSFLNKNFIRLSEDAKAQFVNDWSWSMDAYRFVLFTLTKSNPKYIHELFELDSYLNGLAINSSSFARNYVKNSDDPDLEILKNKTNYYRNRILKYSSESVDITDPYYRQMNDSLKILESQISNITFQKYLKSSELWNSLTSISSKLNNKDAFLSIFRISDSLNSKHYSYYALIIKANSEFEIKKLCNEDSLQKRLNFNSILGIHSQVKELYSSRGGKILDENPIQIQDLYSLAWANLDTSLKEFNTIWYNPSGYYNKIAVSALKRDNSYVVESYNLNQISHPSVLFNDPLFINKSKVILVGGLKYDENFEQESEIKLGNSRSLRSGQKSWDYLPGTQEEILKIKDIAFNKNWATLLYSDTSFTESSFIKLNQFSQNAILHIATHGFYISGKSKGSEEFQQHDPLEDAGLILSGGNKGWQGLTNGGINDGILTGREIANTDLSGLYLVSLSACETGLGEIQGNEGVFGLPRAFKLAGVNYIISSLWQVPDKQTAEFMELFYSYLFNDIPIEQAFRQTQIELSKKYEPWFWAGFVLSR